MDNFVEKLHPVDLFMEGFHLVLGNVIINNPQVEKYIYIIYKEQSRRISWRNI